MTLEEIKRSGELLLIPKDVAPVLGCDPEKIRIQAHENPTLLGFPVVVIGTRVRIPRKPFLQWLGEA